MSKIYKNNKNNRNNRNNRNNKSLAPPFLKVEKVD